MRWIDFHWTPQEALWRTGGGRGLVVGLLLASLTLGGRAQQPASQGSTRVEVRLYHRTSVESATLTPKRGEFAVHLPSGGASVLRIRPGETVTLGRRQSDVYVRRGDSVLHARSLRLAPTRGATWALAPGTRSARTYTGGLALAPDSAGETLQLVNHAPLDDYVASVVASEYGFEDQEGAKAMAVAARTYALHSSKHPETSYEQVDGTASQVYRGTDAITETARRATRQTRGQILTYEEAPIQAVYFSSSGGHTADNEDVWTGSDPLPYLRGKKDPYDRASPHHRWTARINRRALLQTLTLHQNASVEGILLGDRTSGRRLATIELLHSDGPETEIEAGTFRRVVNRGVEGTPVKSTWFDARREGSEYVFEGRGYGHGVGLSQWGAHAIAQQGKSYREILSFYYTGVEIEQRSDLSLPSSRPPLADEATVTLPDSTQRDTTSGRIGW